MGKEITLVINNQHVQCQEGVSILEAADQAGIYIPRLCFHPYLPCGPKTTSGTVVYRTGTSIVHDNLHDTVFKGCSLCIVEIEGRGLCQSCSTPAEDGMVICSDTATVKELRRDAIAHVMSLHPHACILCTDRDGCNRQECTHGVQLHDRCCQKFDNCEFRKVSEFVTIRDDVSQYAFKNSETIDATLFTINPNLCIGCGRCVRACEKITGKRAISFVYSAQEFFLGTSAATMKESGCVLCGGCVQVCPTGALLEKGLPWKKKEKLNLGTIIVPPEEYTELTEETVKSIPKTSGVFQLINENNEVILIQGTSNLNQDVEERLKTVKIARFIRYEEHDMFTMRETELLQKFLKNNGRLPEVNDEISDLY